MEFVEAPVFTELLLDYLDDEGYRALQTRLAGDPEAGEVIPGTGGFRKVRWADPARGKGERGGLRVIYYHFPADNQIWFATLYGKGEVADLSTAEKRQLKDAVGAEAARRAARRSRRS